MTPSRPPLDPLMNTIGGVEFSDFPVVKGLTKGLIARDLHSATRITSVGPPRSARVGGIFSRRTNRMHEARVYSHDGPIGHSKRGYILTTDQSEQKPDPL
eukprot:755354-Prorocentrum_minimum.AAC.1